MKTLNEEVAEANDKGIAGYAVWIKPGASKEDVDRDLAKLFGVLNSDKTEWKKEPSVK